MISLPCTIAWPLLRRSALSLALLAAGELARAQPADSAALDRMITDTMREQQIPAVSVALAKGDRIVYSRAFGTADLENAVAATPETLIRTASIAKSITAVAAMTLVEAGKLDLDAPVQTYCPPFPPKQWPVTTRELLSHTAGIRHYNPGEPEHTQHYKWMADGFALFAADPLLFQPGTAYSYSTYGYTVAGCAIEGASGTRFQDYVAEHVLKPAGMTHTLVDDALEVVPHRARGYQKIDGQVKNATLMDSSYKIPGGGYVTTAEDLVRFARGLWSARLLRAETVAQMWTATPASGQSAYGLGFAILEEGKFITHTGGQAGTTTRLFIIPHEHFAVAVLANMDNVQLTELVRQMVLQEQLPFPAGLTH
jgi:serine beta-lactamase-like protein LACTB, mitochondrial